MDVIIWDFYPFLGHCIFPVPCGTSDTSTTRPIGGQLGPVISIPVRSFWVWVNLRVGVTICMNCSWCSALLHCRFIWSDL
jgi:hypothetical protein